MDGVGPWEPIRDFQIERTCIEVKTSTAVTFDRLSISSERQLEVPAEIHCCCLGSHWMEGLGHGATLPEIVESTRVAASESGCQHLLDSSLGTEGLFGGRCWPLFGYMGIPVRSLHPFLVEEGFPKIVSGDLQAGISECVIHFPPLPAHQFQFPFERPAELLEGLPMTLQPRL